MNHRNRIEREFSGIKKSGQWDFWTKRDIIEKRRKVGKIELRAKNFFFNGIEKNYPCTIPRSVSRPKMEPSSRPS